MILHGKTKKEIEKDTQRKNAEATIVELKKYLSDTDYVILKCIEVGDDPKKIYPDIIHKRNEARKIIKRLENELYNMEES